VEKAHLRLYPWPGWVTELAGRAMQHHGEVAVGHTSQLISHPRIVHESPPAMETGVAVVHFPNGGEER